MKLTRKQIVRLYDATDGNDKAEITVETTNLQGGAVIAVSDDTYSETTLVAPNGDRSILTDGAIKSIEVEREEQIDADLADRS